MSESDPLTHDWEAVDFVGAEDLAVELIAAHRARLVALLPKPRTSGAHLPTGDSVSAS